MKLTLILILFTGLLFCQSASEKRIVSEEIFDISSKMKVLSQALLEGEIQGVKLSDVQMVDIQDQYNQAISEIVLLTGGEVVAKDELNPIVFEGLQYFRDNANTRFYKANRPNSVNRMQEMIDVVQ